MVGPRHHHKFACRVFGNQTLGSLAVSSPHPILVRRFFISIIAWPAAHYDLAFRRHRDSHLVHHLGRCYFFLDIGVSSA